MRATLLLTILLFGVSLAGPAQVLRPGWLLPLAGDTLRGQVEDDNWNTAPEQVRFRPAPEAALTTYPATGLRAFGLRGGAYYRRETVPLDRSARTLLGQLNEGLHIRQEQVPLLVEVLVDGPAQLWYTAVEDVPHYFVRRPGQPVMELTARRYLNTTPDGVTHLTDGNNYHGQLQQYFGDCPAALTAASRAAFGRGALAQVVQAYNLHCDAGHQLAPSYIAVARAPRLGLQLSVLGGGRYSSGQLHSSNTAGSPSDLDGLNFDGRLHGIGGLEADLLSPGRRLAVHLAGLVADAGRTGSVPTRYGQTGQLYNRYVQGEIRLGVRYLWPLRQGQTRLLVGTGLTYPVLLSSGSAHYLVYGTTGGHQTYLDALYTYPANDGGFFPNLPYVEVGLRQRRLSLLLDGRLGSQQTYYDAPNLATTPSGLYSQAEYTYRSWYVSLLLGFALLRRD